jgi:hypothetical protein
MAERLTLSKIIRDLTSRPPEPEFGPEWQARNAIDIAAARMQTAAARAARGPELSLLMVQERPEEREAREQMENDLDDEFEDGDDRESVEELPGRGPWA